MLRIPHQSFRIYFFAVVAVLISALTRLGLDPWLDHNAPFVTYYIAIFLVAWQGGVGPAIVTTLLSLLLVSIFAEDAPFLYGSLTAGDRWASSSAHLAVALVLSLFARLMDHSRRKALSVATVAVHNETALKRSEERFQLALEAGKMASWELDITNGTFLGSTGLEQLLGCAAGTFDGTVRGYLKATDPRDRAILLDALQKSITEKVDFCAEYRIRNSQGATTWVESRGRLIGNEDQDICRMTGMLSNITARKESEASRAQLSAIVESSADAIIGEDLDGIITSWNDAAARLFGYPSAVAKGLRSQEVIDPHQKSDIEQISSMIHRGTPVQNHETVLSTIDEDDIWVSLSAAPIRDEKGAIIGVSKTFRDITATRKALDQELILTEATALLSMTLDCTRALESLAQLAAAKLSDHCLIYYRAEENSPRELIAEASRGGTPLNLEAKGLLLRGIQGGQPLWSESKLESGRLALYRHMRLGGALGRSHGSTMSPRAEQIPPSSNELTLPSVAIVPLAAHTQVYGAFVLIRGQASTPFDASDLKFLDELGRRVTLAIENARLFADAQNAIFRHEEELRERIRIEEQLRQSEQLYRAIGESIDYGIWICNPEGKVLYVSETFLSLLGHPLEKWSNCHEWGNNLPPDEAQRIFTAWQHCVQTGSKWDREITFETVHGEKIPVLSRGVPVRDQHGAIQCWAGIHLDISRQKKAEADLIRAKEEADTANAAKSAFLANMSHEIRTPLGAIVGFSEILASCDQDPREKAECSAIIKRNGALLSGIINDILDLSKIEAGHLALELFPVDLMDLLAETRAGLSLPAADKNLSLAFECAAPFPGWVQTDPTRLKQILTNIIGNAIKFTDQGFVRVLISARKDQGQNKIRFEVEDTGCGLSPDESSRLFEAFSQADVSTTRRFGGTGLGLALSRRLARKLGGDVFLLKSAPQKGSTFVIEIALSTEFSPSLLGPLSVAPAPSSLDHSLEGLKILVVEDSPDNRLLMTTILKRAGAEIDVAENGQEGVKKALDRAHDVILMDVQMPVMDGFAAASQLRQEGYAGPIIALTAHALAEDRTRCLQHGFDDHMGKPVTPQRLVQGLKRYHPNSSAMPAP